MTELMLAQTDDRASETFFHDQSMAPELATILLHSFADTVANFTQRHQTLSYLQTITQNLKALNNHQETFDLITVADNQQFVYRFVQGCTHLPAKFLTVENHILKQLNDTHNPFFSKAMIDQANDLYRRIMLGHLHADPSMTEKLIGKYYDYKSMRLAFAIAVPTEKIQDLFVRTNFDFAQKLKQAGFDKALKLNPSGFTQHPQQWFAGGLGTSVDEAGFYARFARDYFAHRKLQLASAEDRLPHLPPRGLQEKVQLILAQIQIQQAAIIKFLSKSPRAITRVEMAPGKFSQLPTAEVFEVLRKVKAASRQDYINVVRQKFLQRFQLQLTGQQVIQLRDYYAHTDHFSPGVIAIQRIIHQIKETETEMVSFDVVGLGAKNALATATAIERFHFQNTQFATGVINLPQLLQMLRQEDARITSELEQMRNIIRQAMSEAFEMELHFESTNGKMMTFSGDEGIVKIPDSVKQNLIAQHGPTRGPERYERMYDRMLILLREKLSAQHLPARSLRITRAHRGVSSNAALGDNTLERLVAIQEKFEQLVREGMVARSSMAAQEQVMYLFEGRYQPADNGGPWMSMTFQVRVLGASSEEYAAITEEIQKAIATQNEKIRAQDIHFLKCVC